MQRIIGSGKTIDCQKIKVNLWKQGAFLFVDANTRISIETPSMKDYLPEGLYVVLTQDCDLLNSDPQKEPVAELILAYKKMQAKAQFLLGKNPRTLYLELNTMEENYFLEFLPQNRFFIARSHLESQIATDFLDPKNLKVLIHWMTNRYKRPGFPHSFNQRLKDKTDTIKKILDEYGHSTLGLFIRLSTEEELSESEIYSVYMVMLVEKSIREQEDKLEKIEKGFEKIIDLLSQVHGINLLEESEVQSMDRISAHEYSLLKQWDFDYLSFSNDRNGVTAYDIGM
jgi:hypothetical protein